MVERVLPCGMPWVMVWNVDCAEVVWSDCVRLVKYDVNSASVSGWKLNLCLSLWRSFLCDIVSYALVRSRNSAIVGCLCCLLLIILSMIVVSAIVVSELGRNA